MFTIMRIAAGVLSAISSILLTACGGAGAPPNRTNSLPDGWRWESFLGVEVGVPDNFGWGGTEQALGQWCVNEDRQPLVGRPFVVSTAVGCGIGDDGRPPPESLVVKTGPIVAFEYDRDVREAGDRKVIRHGKVSVIIQVKEPLRSRIVKTVRFVEDADWAGCPKVDPISNGPYGSPKHGVDVSTIRDVQRVSVCRYRVKSELPPGLLASSVLTGTEAAAALAAIAAAPKGSGPNLPDCSPALMSEIVVLRVRTSTGESRIHVRYEDCDKLGFDDGVAVRRLTKAGLSRILVGPHFPDSYSSHLEDVMPRESRR